MGIVGLKRGPYGKHFTDAQRTRAIELCLWAIRSGWSLTRFCRLSGVPKGTMNFWLTEDSIFERYKRAREVQAVALPDVAMDIVRRVIDGVEVEEELLVDGKVEKIKRRHFIDPAAARVGISHIEFRLMREHKGRMYANDKTLTVKRQIDDLTDREVVARYEELERKALEAAQQQIEGAARDVTEETDDDR